MQEESLVDKYKGEGENMVTVCIPQIKAPPKQYKELKKFQRLQSPFGNPLWLLIISKKAMHRSW